jgi:hypothetical protein
MWNVLVLAILFSVAGYYAMSDQKYAAAAQPANQQLTLAGDMAIYRQAVIDYYKSNPGAPLDAGVPNSALTPFFPEWSDKAALSSQWSNWIDGTYHIYIYEQAPLPINIVSSIVKLSQNSVQAGAAVVQGGQQVLYAPADIPTALPSTMGSSSGLPYASDYASHDPVVLPAAAAIPTGSPVWMACWPN